MMDADEMFEVGSVLLDEAVQLRAALNEAQPRTTREQWEVLDNLNSAAQHMLTASQKMFAHEEGLAG